MNEKDILIHALRIASAMEREAFLIRECQDDPDKLATVRRVVSQDNEIRKWFASIDDADLPQHIEELLAEGTPASSAADEATCVMAAKAPADEDARLQETRVTESPSNEGVTIADRFVLEHKIGAGGMGEVWAARQIAPVKRKVALKLIKPGMDIRLTC